MIRLNLLKKNTVAMLSSKTCRNFSKLDLEIHRQKSHLAEIIIAMIVKPRTFKQIQRRSLVDQIKEQFKYYPQYDQKVRDEMLQFFTKGVEYNTLIFDQSRHKTQILGNPQKKKAPTLNLNILSQGQQKNSNLSSSGSLRDQQKQQAKVQNSQLNMEKGSKAEANSVFYHFPQQNLIRFYPTTLISSQVFHNILYSNIAYELLVGHKGISKSISVQLYWYLSNIIVSYRCRPEHQRVPPLQMLYSYGVPKLLYWSIEPGQDQQVVRSKILSQCPELGDDLVNSSYLRDRGKKIKQFYRKKGIQVILFIDQLSLYANRFRHKIQNRDPEYIRAIKAKQAQNKEISPEEKQKLNDYSKFSADHIEQQMLMHDSYMMLHRQFFDRKLFSSSVGIQRSILKKMELTRQQSQVSVQIKRIRFEEYLCTHKALYELIDCFMCEVKQKIRSPLFQSSLYTDDQNKKKMRDYLFEKFKVQSKKFYINPLTISMNLRQQSENYSSQLNDIDLSTEDYIQQACRQLEKLFVSCLNYSRDQLHERVSNFLKNTDKQQRLMILSEFYLQKGFSSDNDEEREEKDYYEQEPRKKYTFNVKHLEKQNSNHQMKQIYNPEKKGLIEKESQQMDKMDRFIDKQLFEYHKNGDVSCYFNYEDIYEDLNSINPDVIDFILSHSEIMMSKIHDWTSYGKTFENLFLQTFMHGRFNVKFSVDPAMEFNNLHEEIFPFKEVPNPDKDSKNSKKDRSPNKKDNPQKTPNNTDKKIKSQKEIQEYSFLESFKKSFDYIQKKNISEAVFIALNENDFQKIDLSGDEKQKIEISHFARSNPNIDIIFMKYSRGCPDQINLYAIDLTTQTRKEKIMDKFSNFLRNFSQFKDNGETQIQVNNKEVKVNLHYYVISPLHKIGGGQNQKSFPGLLKDRQDAKNFNFKQIEGNRLEVTSLKKNDKEGQTYLKRMGHISMEKQSMQLSRRSGDQIHQSLWFYDRLVKSIQHHIKKREK